jgi:hypothetical protein
LEDESHEEEDEQDSAGQLEAINVLAISHCRIEELASLTTSFGRSR